jgi:hypothetical protein
MNPWCSYNENYCQTTSMTLMSCRYIKAEALLVHIHGLSLRILHGLYMALLVQSFACINALLHKICFNLVDPRPILSVIIVPHAITTQQEARNISIETNLMLLRPHGGGCREPGGSEGRICSDDGRVSDLDGVQQLPPASATSHLRCSNFTDLARRCRIPTDLAQRQRISTHLAGQNGDGLRRRTEGRSSDDGELPLGMAPAAIAMARSRS